MNVRYLSLISLTVLAFACGKKSASSEEAPAEEATAEAAVKPDQAAAEVAKAPPTSNEFLVGLWQSGCINQPGFLQASVYLQYEFLADGSALAKTLSYANADCVKRFTKADIDNIRNQVNADRAAQGLEPLSPAEVKAYDNLWFPQPSKFQYSLGRKLKDESIEMNTKQIVLDKEVSQFLMIFVQDGSLYFAETCLQSDYEAGICSQVVGDSESNRARDLTRAIPFNKM